MVGRRVSVVVGPLVSRSDHPGEIPYLARLRGDLHAATVDTDETGAEILLFHVGARDAGLVESHFTVRRRWFYTAEWTDAEGLRSLALTQFGAWITVTPHDEVASGGA